MSDCNIFISYRRDDTAGHAGRIFDRLKVRFPGRVFMDVTGIELGDDFVQAIDRQVGACGVFIELIGKEWATDRLGTRRINQPQDWVRLEVAAALRRSIPIIPVLVHGATMPDASTLPSDIAPLTRHEALQITEPDFDYDVERLVHRLESVFGRTSAAAPFSPPIPPARKSHPGRLALLIGVAVVGLFIVGAIGLFVLVLSFSPNTDTVENSAPVNAQKLTPETASSNSNSDKSSNSSTTDATASSEVADELHTPAKGSSERQALMDALREEFDNPQSRYYRRYQGSILFVVNNLKVHNGWAWTYVEPHSAADPSISFGEGGSFLLHQEGGQWRVMKLPSMVEDPNDPENLDYPTRKDVERIRKIYPSIATDIFQK